MALTDVLSFKPTKREVLSGIAPHLFKERPCRKPSRRREQRPRRSPLAVSESSTSFDASSVILVSEASPQEIKGIMNHLQEDASRRGSEDVEERVKTELQSPNSGKVFLRMKTAMLFKFGVVKKDERKVKVAQFRRRC